MPVEVHEMDVEDQFRKMVDLGIGLITYSSEKIAEAARQWAEEKRMTPQQTKEFVQELVERGEKERAEFQNSIQESVQRTLTRLGIREDQEALRAEIRQLRAMIERLDARVAELEARLGNPGEPQA
ncbi:hypothetical protein TC41_2881 [Alicyclobacillus acidocaldarius subsp. acidocaldarius Tc-4-1]|uniref:Poly(Hydroxyalkanoate) granule-associated protein n=2 Tax=Alicyclobacillus acidocaldarius TaxID=405212 RepID=F8IK66_ALIAT|nr:hypothetical protein TC41_2881 [Alicyclobacillus acidocaldarius subsp. acidocaldarius Tc-4-1]